MKNKSYDGFFYTLIGLAVLTVIFVIVNLLSQSSKVFFISLFLYILIAKLISTFLRVSAVKDTFEASPEYNEKMASSLHRMGTFAMFPFIISVPALLVSFVALKMEQFIIAGLSLVVGGIFVALSVWIFIKRHRYADWLEKRWQRQRAEKTPEQLKRAKIIYTVIVAVVLVVSFVVRLLS